MAATVFSPGNGWAHCDGLDGPVVLAGQKALETGRINPVLIWVQQEGEAEVSAAFEQARTVRALSPVAQALADRYFLETLVRVHRAGEGAPYTGLKPAGRDLGPAIPAADQTLVSGAIAPLGTLLTESVHHSLHALFQDARAKRDFAAKDIEAGRAYINAYVDYIHFVERLYQATQPTAHGHYGEAEAVTVHDDLH
jgi:hypothetical protein